MIDSRKQYQVIRYIRAGTVADLYLKDNPVKYHLSVTSP
jgi:hypothetical protein